jgi:hypothetical protein
MIPDLPAVIEPFAGFAVHLASWTAWAALHAVVTRT